MSIYVEILIRAPMEAVWQRTQTPADHQRWDLRFSRIDYLARTDGSEPQRFRYSTRIGFGLAITGEGETVGERDLRGGGRASALRFWSGHPLSLIRQGSGYWRYEPTAGGVRFVTRYDYATRFGRAGAAVDRLLFRPLMGWATAWSFDRLRLWLEQGLDPARAQRQALTHGVARIGMATIFGYQGLVPKLLWPHADEVAMLRDAGIRSDQVGAVIATLGTLELLVAAAVLLFWRDAWPVGLMAAIALVATVIVALFSPRYLGAAFGPVALSVAVVSLAAVVLLARRDLPSASRCKRSPEARP